MNYVCQWKIKNPYQLTTIKILHSFKNPKKTTILPLYSLVPPLKLNFTIHLVSSPSFLSPRLSSKEAAARSFRPRGGKKKKEKKKGEIAEKPSELIRKNRRGYAWNCKEQAFMLGLTASRLAKTLYGKSF